MTAIGGDGQGSSGVIFSPVRNAAIRTSLTKGLAILVPGGIVLGRYLLDPMGMYLFDKESSHILFFPSITIAAATLVLLAFRDEYRWLPDHELWARRTAA